jgi:toxin ParE1/3/4
MNSFRFSSDANSDVAGIALHLVGLNPVAADRFLGVLDETCELLAHHPLIGRARPELGENVRSFPVGNYLVFYVPRADGVDIARVIYGGRDLPGVFGQ